MAKELKAGRECVIPNIGKAVVKRVKAKPARDGRNPQTGESMKIKAQPAKNVVRLKPQKALKELV
jgi:nucleoid DNA-binding protein